MTKSGAILLSTSLMLTLQACAMAPMGPTVQVLPGRGKPFELFAQERNYCAGYAGSTVQGQADVANQRAVGGAVLGTVLGAGLGAAVGGGRGAGIGAASGAVVGTGFGANSSAYSQDNIQAQYDNAYVQCMVSKGNVPPAPPVVVVEQPSYYVAPAPYYRPGGYYRRGYGY